jgi:hypothetical protein
MTQTLYAHMNKIKKKRIKKWFSEPALRAGPPSFKKGEVALCPISTSPQAGITNQPRHLAEVRGPLHVQATLGEIGFYSPQTACFPIGPTHASGT